MVLGDKKIGIPVQSILVQAFQILKRNTEDASQHSILLFLDSLVRHSLHGDLSQCTSILSVPPVLQPSPVHVVLIGSVLWKVLKYMFIASSRTQTQTLVKPFMDEISKCLITTPNPTLLAAFVRVFCSKNSAVTDATSTLLKTVSRILFFC